MKRSELSAIFSMPPDEAVAWLRKKKLRLSWDYTEVWGEAHRRTFTVAKIMKLDLLGDIHRSLTEALEQGKPFREWQEELRPTLAAKGWYGKTEVINPETGEVKTITVGAHRLRTIYESNMRSAYNYGRYLHQSRSKTLTYWMYVSALLPTTRPSHRAMHGSVYPREHPFWTAHYPPNGYNCKCKVRAYSKSMIERRGLRVKEDYEPFADPGFSHPPAGGLDRVWERKILDAPKKIRPLAKMQREMVELYEKSFEADEEIRKTMLANRPEIIPALRKEAGYRYDSRSRRHIIYVPAHGVDLATMRHESGHAADHMMGIASRRLSDLLQSDVEAMKSHRPSIKQALIEHFDDDVAMHDLFYLSTDKWVGYPTREDDYFSKEKKHLEAFANFFEIYLSADKKRIKMVDRWFPDSWRAFLSMLEALRRMSP
jgi:SPP1 gp7 family putative phage head morphogenesis protein